MIDQIRLLQRVSYNFSKNNDLLEAIKNRKSEFMQHDLQKLAELASENQKQGNSGSKWSGVLKKVRGKFTASS